MYPGNAKAPNEPSPAFGAEKKGAGETGADANPPCSNWGLRVDVNFN